MKTEVKAFAVSKTKEASIEEFVVVHGSRRPVAPPAAPGPRSLMRFSFVDSIPSAFVVQGKSKMKDIVLTLQNDWTENIS